MRQLWWKISNRGGRNHEEDPRFESITMMVSPSPGVAPKNLGLASKFEDHMKKETKDKEKKLQTFQYLNPTDFEKQAVPELNDHRKEWAAIMKEFNGTLYDREVTD